MQNYRKKQVLFIVYNNINESPDNLYQWYFGCVDKSLEDVTFWNPDELLDKWLKNTYFKLLSKKVIRDYGSDRNILLIDSKLN